MTAILLFGGCPFAIDDGSISQPDDASVQDDASVEGAAQDPAQHRTCRLPAPRELPASPSIHRDATGRPTFDLWRDLPCDELIYASCAEEVSNDCVRCPESNAPSSCDFTSAVDDCGADNAAFTHRDGACHACLTIAAKARACCLNVPHFDCRAWPFDPEELSRPGEVCAGHADCEAGLLCVGGHSGYGVCACPEVDPVVQRDVGSCKGKFEYP